MVLYKEVLTFNSVDEILIKLDYSMKAIEQSFHVVIFEFDFVVSIFLQFELGHY